MRIIAVASCKGGVGKTTVTANLGSALVQEFNKNVLLVDGNLTGGSLGFHFGINYPTKTIVDCANATKEDRRDTFYLHSNGCKLLLAPVHFDSRIEPSCLENVINRFEEEEEEDYIIIDAAPGLGREALTCLQVAKEILLVSTPDIPTVTNTIKTYEMARKYKKKVIGLVLNQVGRKVNELNIAEVEQMTNGLKVITSISKSDDIPKSIALQEPLVTSKPNSIVSVQFKKLAGYLVGKHYEERNLLYKIKGILNLIKEGKVSKSETLKAGESEKSRMINDIMRDVLDVEKLKDELTHEIKNELKESMKKELIEKLRKKLKERGL